ncbi:hypothetical protein GCM10011320_60570 [Neoroseomonas lacus]|uniref:Uncharacterized protein n=1 Tax=Neoroseomonas lacus TaxID=287609 RepID=A0A917P1H6_9PROT|nr:hypothetical protein GCM10011320_60570 [Neoroseomonas lacus]
MALLTRLHFTAWVLGAAFAVALGVPGNLAAQPALEPGWRFTVTPYAWAPTNNGMSVMPFRLVQATPRVPVSALTPSTYWKPSTSPA